MDVDFVRSRVLIPLLGAARSGSVRWSLKTRSYGEHQARQIHFSHSFPIDREEMPCAGHDLNRVGPFLEMSPQNA